MHYKKKPKWQQKEYIPVWMDELVYKPLNLEKCKERFEQAKKNVEEMKKLGLCNEDYEVKWEDYKPVEYQR